MRLWAHRGSHGAGGPVENTLEAFERALVEAADGVEVDVHLSVDRVPLVFHDDDLARMTAGRDRRPLSRLDAAEAARVELAGGGRIPTLAQVVDLVEGRARLNVEIKDPAAVGPVADVLSGHRAEGWVVLSSFSGAAVQRAAELLPALPRALIAEIEVPDLLGVLRHIGATAWHPSVELVSAAGVAALHAAGVAVNVWTVNEPDEARRLAGWGVDGVFTDHPGALRRSL